MQKPPESLKRKGRQAALQNNIMESKDRCCTKKQIFQLLPPYEKKKVRESIGNVQPCPHWATATAGLSGWDLLSPPHVVLFVPLHTLRSPQENGTRTQ